jgi:hypothetical protein
VDLIVMSDCSYLGADEAIDHWKAVPSSETHLDLVPSLRDENTGIVHQMDNSAIS